MKPRNLKQWVGLLCLMQFTGKLASQDYSGPPPSVTNTIYFQRWLWHRQDRLMPDGHVPNRARERALERIRQLKAQTRLTPTAVVTGNAWAPIGPAPIFNGQTSGSQPVSGRIGDIAVNPSNYNHWVIGTAQGGVWETLNAGATWKALTDDQASLAHGAVSFAPSATNILYAGTGEQVFSGDAVSGAGFLKSIDGGATWQLLAAAIFSGTTFSTIRVHPSDPNVLLTSTARGIYKSTDGGTNWTQKRSGTGTDIEVDSGDFRNQYCAIGSIGGSSANGVYRSRNLGETWTLISGPWSSMNVVGRIELAISRSNPSTLYVSIANSSSSGLLGMWRTDNAWDSVPTWMRLPDPGSGFGNLWYNHDLIVDPTNPNIIYAGATRFKKFDGATWLDVLGTMHVDQHALAWAGNRLIIGNDGGLWSTINGGLSYINHNTNLQLTQFYHGSISSTNASFALGGSQDNGTARWNGTNGWRLIFGGDGADNAISAANPAIHWAISFQNLEIERTRNGGANFEDATTGIGSSGRPFIGRFEKAHRNDNIFITGTSQIWKTTNFFSGASVSWFSNSPAFGASFRSGAFAKADPTDNTYACGFSGGPMRLTTDGGATWRDLDPLNNVPSRSIYDLSFNPTTANILYACLSGSSGGTPANVYRTTNALAATPRWANVSYPADLSANSIAMDQNDPNILYVGTDIGVWKTTDGGSNWFHMGPELGLPNVEVDELRLNNSTDRLIAFTHGRGAFALVRANTSDLTITQTENADPASVGCQLIYTLTVVNRGPSDATGVVLTNQLPLQATFNGASASQGTFAVNEAALVFNLGSIPLLGNATMTVVVTPTQDGMLTNSANVVGDQTDPQPLNNFMSEVTSVQVDTGAPELVSAASEPDGYSVILTFSESVSLASATNAANYSVIDGRSNAVAITALEAGPTQGTIRLSADFLSRFGPWHVTVGGVEDCIGNRMASNVTARVSIPDLTLVPKGAFWRYLDDGSNQGTAWRDRLFNDASWSSGQAQLGYGDGDERTELSYGPDPNAKYVTAYFRHVFVLEDSSVWTNLVLSVLRDDGVIVYLNGVQVFRNNMPGGAVLDTTVASSTINGADESTFLQANVNSTLLISGTNVLAAEIHQASGTSSDISFDLSLTAQLRLILFRPLYIHQPESQTVLVGDDVKFMVTVSGTPPFGYRWRFNASTIVPFGAGTPMLLLTNVQTTNAGAYSCVVSNAAVPSGVLSSNAILIVLVDSDGDRMPDEWEIASGLNRDDPSDGAQDADGDGIRNVEEYVAGTDPHDAQSYLKIDELSVATGSVALQFNAISNKTYSVIYRDALGIGPWFKLKDVGARPTNHVETILDSSPSGVERYYRLVTPKQL